MIDTNKKVIREIRRVVLEIAYHLESKEQFAKLSQSFDGLLKQDKFGDLELLIESLFSNVIGADSKTARVLKAIHQNIIFTAVFQLKSKVPMTTMTRDVRTREGWR